MLTSKEELRAIKKAQSKAKANATLLPLDSQIRTLNASVQGKIGKVLNHQTASAPIVAAHLDCLGQTDAPWVLNPEFIKQKPISEINQTVQSLVYKIRSDGKKDHYIGIDQIPYQLALDSTTFEGSLCSQFGLLGVSLDHFTICLIRIPDELDKKPVWMEHLVKSTFNQYTKASRFLGDLAAHNSPGEFDHMVCGQFYPDGDALSELKEILENSENTSHALAFEIVSSALDTMGDDFLYRHPHIDFDCSENEFLENNSAEDIEIFLDSVRFELCGADCFYEFKDSGHKTAAKAKKIDKEILKQLQADPTLKASHEGFTRACEAIEHLKAQSVYLAAIEMDDTQAQQAGLTKCENDWQDMDLMQLPAMNLVMVGFKEHTEDEKAESLIHHYIDRVINESGLDMGNCRLNSIHDNFNNDDEYCYPPIALPLNSATDSQIEKIYEFYSERELFKAMVEQHHLCSVHLKNLYARLREIALNC